MKTKKTKKTTTTTITTTIKDKTAIIRVARVANALAFAKHTKEEAFGMDKPIKLRQSYYSTFIAGAWLYEAIHLIDYLVKDYGTRKSFSKLMLFSERAEKKRDAIAEFNLHPSFTLDWSGGITIDALERGEEIDIFSLGLTSLVDDDNSELSFRSIYQFDSAILLDKLEENADLTDLAEIGNLITTEIPLLISLFISGAKEFIYDLCKPEMTLIEDTEFR